MTGRVLRACLGMGAFLITLVSLGAPAAIAAPGSLKWIPSFYDFGPVSYGSGPTEPREFTLTNTGESQVVIKNWRYSYVEAWPEAWDPFGSPTATSTSNPCVGGGQSLEPGEGCSIQLVFEPLHPGSWWSAVRVRGEGEELWTELPVSGEGVGPWVPLTPNHLTFGSVTSGMTTVPQTVVVENQDPQELRIESITTTASSGGAGPLASSPFRVVGGTCQKGGSLAPGKTCTVEVLMAPTEAGTLRSTLEIVDSAPDSPQSVDLEGIAVTASSNSAPTIPGGVTGAVPQASIASSPAAGAATGSTITPKGVGALRLGATSKALRRKGLIGGLRKGCELDPGQRIAPLRAPLHGWAVFESGHKGLRAVTVEGGAETTRHIQIGSTAAEARKAYPEALYEAPGTVKPFAEGFLWVPNLSKPKLTMTIEPETRLVEAISVPSPNFCE